MFDIGFFFSSLLGAFIGTCFGFWFSMRQGQKMLDETGFFSISKIPVPKPPRDLEPPPIVEPPEWTDDEDE